METISVNLYGGAGIGKSTVAAETFSMLKWTGVEVELVTEFAKDLVWEKSFHRLGYQFGIFAEQHRRMERLRGQVQIIVTDSPLLLTLAYGINDESNFGKVVFEEYEKYNNLDIVLRRNPKKDRYAQAGTLKFAAVENRNRAENVDRQVRQVLEDLNLPYVEMDVEPRKTAQAVALAVGKLYNK